MNPKYYVDLDARRGPGPLDLGEVSFLMSQMFKGTHLAIVQECGENASSQNEIAIAFPLACETGHGGLLRVFSEDEKVLGRFLRHPHIHRYVRHLDATIQELPAIQRFATFSRNRVADRLSPSARKRARHRLKELGFAIPAKQDEQPGFVIALQSQSNGETFLLRIQRRALPERRAVGGAAFNAYGLSRTHAVPMF